MNFVNSEAKHKFPFPEPLNTPHDQQSNSACTDEYELSKDKVAEVFINQGSFKSWDNVRNLVLRKLAAF